MNKNVADIVNKRKVILGPRDRIKSSSLSKYPWAYKLFKDMQENEWKASGIDLTKDKPQNLNIGTQLGMKRGFAFLTGLDGIAVENLTYNVVEHITDYTIQQCIYRQIYEEANHVDSYATCIETFYEDPTEIYLLHENDELLTQKNDYVLAQANDLSNEFSAEKFVYAVISNILLEGIYFHTGFLFFYAVAKFQRQMTGAAEMIQYIQRDETTHLVLFTNIFNTLKKEFPEVFTAKVYDRIDVLFDTATNWESKWGKHLIEKGVPGLTANYMETYTKDLANKRRNKIGLESLYSNIKNPYPWVDDYSLANKNEKNFFESKPQAYSTRILDFED